MFFLAFLGILSHSASSVRLFDVILGSLDFSNLVVLRLLCTVSYTGFGMLGTCVVTFVLMFLPKSRQMTAMGREGFFLEASTGGVATITVAE